MTALFAALTAQERYTLANMLLSGSRELIEEKMRLRRAGDNAARYLYGTDADAYVGAIDDVHGVLNDLLAPVLMPTGTGWPVAS